MRTLVLIRAVVACCAFLGAISFAARAKAITWLAAPPPVTFAIDANGVDLGTGSLVFQTTEVVIGQPASGGLSYERSYIGSGWRDNLSAGINSSGAVYTVSIGGSSETFTLASGVYTSDQGSGATLAYDAGSQRYTYTTSAGVIVILDKTLAGSSIPWNANEGRAISVTTPAGLVTSFNYVSAIVSGVTWRRLQSVSNNLGYQLHLDYSLNTPTTSGDLTAWRTLTKVTGINNAVDYCGPSAATCTYSVTWPSATYGESGGIETVTDTLGQVTRYVYTGGQLTGIRRPTSASTNHTTIAYSAGRVSSVAGADGTWAYSYSDAGGLRTTTAAGASSRSSIVELATNRITSLSIDGVSGQVYSYDAKGRIDTINDFVTGDTAFTYDARGNVTQIARNSIPTSATFASTCANTVTCNLPTTTTDANGNTTNYTYDSTHGGVTAITQPDPDGAGSLPRPETRFTYSSLYAYYKNSGGSIVAAPSPIALPTAVSACATGSSCAGGPAETKTTITYGAVSAANNLLPTQTSTGAGDALLTATTVTTYNPVGDPHNVDGPLSGTADTMFYRYDAGRRLVGVIGPDPDGGGALLRRAVRTTYNLDGQPTLVEQGTVAGVTDADWAAFAALEASALAYDFQGRPIQRSLIASGAAQGVSQTSYDAYGRAVCTAVRMNAAVFGALPSSACTLSTQGANGPDRIIQQSYDDRGRPLVTTTGYASAHPVAEVSYAYPAFGPPSSMTDGQGNVTLYSYAAGHLTRITYPNPAGGDFEQYSYDNAWNVTQIRNRDGSTVSIAYDHLGRPTQRDLSVGADITTAYDNFGRVIAASISGHALSYVYDALSRLTSESGPLGAVSYQYDLAGRRTRMNWPDGFYVTYDVDLSGAVTALRESGAASGPGVLARFTYDNLGRRTSLTRGNGVVTNYGFDAASRLTSLGNDLVSGGDDSRTYAYNGAFQIIQRTLSNDAYAQSFAVGGQINVANGLNQFTPGRGVAFSYDARGNMSSDGVNAYGYDILNRLISRGSATLGYDPAGRLYQSVAAGVTTRMLYDGAAMIGEYNGLGALQRRFVHGPGMDEPLVWYEGSGTSDRRWLLADERGSIVAVTNASGAATSINAYDEYGVPGAGNVGRFQYTGQMWLSEAGVYHYKARAYAPALGRFLQTDPIGTAGGVNLYAYVGNDPVNFSDPWGLEEEACELPYCGYGSRACPTGAVCNATDIALFLDRGGRGFWFEDFALNGGGGASVSAPPPALVPPPPKECPTGPDIDAAQNAIGLGTNAQVVGGAGILASSVLSVAPQTRALRPAWMSLGASSTVLASAGTTTQAAGAAYLVTQGMPGTALNTIAASYLSLFFPRPVQSLVGQPIEQLLSGLQQAVGISLDSCIPIG